MTTFTNSENDTLVAGELTPEVTGNTALDTLYKAITETTDISVTGVSSPMSAASAGANRTAFLNAVQLRFTGTLTGNWAYEVPSFKKLFIVEHAATASYTITVRRPSQTGITLRYGEKAILFNNGTDVVLRHKLTKYFGFYQASLMTAGSQELMRIKMPQAVMFPAGIPGTKVSVGTNATASKDVTLHKNGAAAFATISIDTAGAATLSCPSDTSFAEGDVLTFVGPASADATLKQLSVVVPAMA